MIVNTDILIPMTDANQNFSRVICIVDEQGAAIILKNNKPRSCLRIEKVLCYFVIIKIEAI